MKNRKIQEHQGRRTRLIKTGADGTMFPRVIEVPDIMPLITSLGEIYGFANSKGDLYFDDVNQYPFFIQTHARAKFQAFLTIFSAYLTIFLLLSKNFLRRRAKIRVS